MSTLRPLPTSDALSTDGLLPGVGRADRVKVALAFTVWLVAALGSAWGGLLDVRRPFLIPACIAGTAFVIVALYLSGGALRRVADAIDPRALVLFHSARGPIGVGFFVLAATSGLDPTFARIAGWGDVAVGLLAPVASLALPSSSRPRARLALAWNLLGFVDILAVFVTAQRVLFFSGHPETMSALLVFPGPLLPLMIVPLVITTHLLIFRRLILGGLPTP